VRAPDTSVLVAGFVSSHRFHEDVLPALAQVREQGNLIAHTIAETYSVLSATGGVYRADPPAVLAYLDQFIAKEPITLGASAYRKAIGLLAGEGRSGGAVYDALIGIAARDADVTLLSLDARAQPVYELCDARVRILADLGG
jgi:predicted nucleic acid-binding protein